MLSYVSIPFTNIRCSFGRANEVIAYFEQQGIEFPAGTNPANVILDSISTTGTGSKGEKLPSWSSKWYESSAYQQLQAKINVATNSIIDPPTSSEGTSKDTFNTSLLRQIRMVSLRIAKNQWRRPQYISSKVWVHLLSGILVGFMFYDIGTSPKDLQNR
jgi:ATP-binding cassette subfamily G (WHITE) protein 2 (SNQ2)